MGEQLLRTHVKAIRQRLDALPGCAKVHRLDVELNVVAFKVSARDDSGERGVRLNFVIYEAESYPNSGGIMMSDDEKSEELLDAINTRLGDREQITVSEALLATCSELDIQDASLLAALQPDTGSSASLSRADELEVEDASSGGDVDVEDAFFFEGDDDANPSALDIVADIADRENRPAWKKFKWQEVEEQRVARKRKQQIVEGDDGERPLEEQKAARVQMWSSQEAFTILSNELFQLQMEADPTLEADACDYDVHRWTVKLRGCSGAVGRDLAELKRRFGYDYIEIILSFKEDLHPFYPPGVHIVRPRLHGRHDVQAALACHPRLQLRGWSCLQTTKDMLVSIRRFLESIARVDLNSEANDLTRHPEGAFSALDRQLAKLGSLSEIVPLDLRREDPGNPYRDDPWAQDEVLTKSSLGAMLQRKRDASKSSGGDKTCQKFWAAGTGYGHDGGRPYWVSGGNGSWDPQAMKAAQIAQDAELQQLLGSITESVRNSAPAPSVAGKGESSRDVDLLCELLAKSCLSPFLAQELSTSYTNMGDRLHFFNGVYGLVQQLLSGVLPKEVCGRLLELSRPHLHRAKAAAQTFLETLGSSAALSGFSEDVRFAHIAVRTADEAERQLGNFWSQGSASQPLSQQERGSSSSSSSTAVASSPFPPGEEREYCRRMKAHQLDHVDFGSDHAFASQADSETVIPQARTLRIAKELAGLVSLLPLSGSSSVFVRVDANRQQLWRALVTGPDDTPYSCGCFVFDVYFPPQYPNEPPHVNLRTTGNGSVTFNPNLYASGLVCLSLLGTWRGEKAESWDSTSSRMLQVLVSIQSLILVPEPYFNEPGYECEIGTEQGDCRSRAYNMVVREACVKWAMVAHLRNPYAELSEAIYEHFRIRGQRAQEIVRAWVDEAAQHGDYSHKARLQTLHRDLTTALARLPERCERNQDNVQSSGPEVAGMDTAEEERHGAAVAPTAAPPG